MPFFKFEGQRIAYTEYGGGPAAVHGRRARAGATAQQRAGARGGR